MNKCTLSSSIVYIILLIIPRYLACSNRELPQRLEVDSTFPDQISNEETCLYLVEDLENKANYELRISYPAVIPTDFILEVSEQSSLRVGRKLLNVEQLHWKAEAKNYLIKVKARRTGVPVDVNKLQDPVPYNIIVNRLYFGCSNATWKLIISLFFTTVLVLRFSLPRLIKLFEDMEKENTKDQ